jgi:hypothetical protein
LRLGDGVDMLKGHERLIAILMVVVFVGLFAIALSARPGSEESQPVGETTTETTSVTASLFAPSPPISGAIFTTTPNGSIVNENVRYPAKRNVYLDGGPPRNAPASAAGLKEGYYVFQITNPNGRVALSEDPAKCRIIRVSSEGVIVELVLPNTLPDLDLTNNYTPISKKGPKGGPKAQLLSVTPCHIPDDPEGAAGEHEQHDTNHDLDHWSDKGAIVVQMMPFLDTPNNGGVYKAWVTPLQSYLDHDGNLSEIPSERGTVKEKGKDVGFKEDPGFGPPRSDVKTDNFKVKDEGKEEPAVLTVRKFHDLDADGVWDSNEPDNEPEIGINDYCVDGDGALVNCTVGGGWPIDITDPLAITTPYFTPVVEITAEPTGTYTIEEELELFDDWAQSVVFIDGSPQEETTTLVTVEVLGSKDEEHEIIFGNYLKAKINGTKFIDLNGNGVKNGGEGCPPAPDVNNPGCENITIYLDGIDNLGDIVDTFTKTDENGDYSFEDLVPGTYDVTIEDPAGFYCSHPVVHPLPCESLDIVLISGETFTQDFGDLSYAEIYGTKWHDINANGERDAGELGLSGVIIKLNGTDGLERDVNDQTTTNSTGGFNFTGLWPGHYHVKEEVPSGMSSSTVTEVWVDLTSDNVTDLGDVFGNYIPVDINGTKFIDLNGDGIKDPGEGCPAPPDPNNAACENITIQLEGYTGGDVYVKETTKTDANGFYSFTGIVPGTYNISVLESGAFICSLPDESCDYDEITLKSGDALTYDFGDFLPVEIYAHKFFDFDGLGTQDEFEADLAGVLICLNNGTGHPVTEDLNGVPIESCQLTDEDGLVGWTNLPPGDYIVYEDLENSVLIGLTNTTPMTVAITINSGETTTVEFGNNGPCNGLTPGYWGNWRNKYNESQFLTLLEGTIAHDNITLADYYLDPTVIGPDNNPIKGCSDTEGALHCLQRFVLANQLTLNLAQNTDPDIFQPNGGLFQACLLSDTSIDMDPPYDSWEGSLGEALNEAFEILSNPDDYNTEEGRQFILFIKTVLDEFAKQFTGS